MDRARPPWFHERTFDWDRNGTLKQTMLVRSSRPSTDPNRPLHGQVLEMYRDDPCSFRVPSRSQNNRLIERLANRLA